MAYRGKESTGSITASHLSSSRGGAGCLVAFSLIFLVVGFGTMVGISGVPIWRWMNAQQWEETPCAIISSQVKIHSGSDNDTYTIDIHCRYEWNGREYESDLYNFIVGSTSEYAKLQAVVDQYPVGTQSRCFVNPGDPHEAVLSRDFVPGYLLGLGIGGLFSGFGVFFCILGIRAFLRVGSRKHSVSERRTTPRLNETTASNKRIGLDDAGPMTLKRKSGRVGKLVGVILVALFWNGIISVFVYGVVIGWLEGEPSFFLTIFMLPFVAVGLFLIVMIGYYFLALFNPRPSLTLNPGVLRLGATSSLRWEMAGSTHRISLLKIWLEGKESATYTVGTNTTTDHNTFAKIPIFETSDSMNMRRGKTEFTLPEFTMHSFKANRNVIAWTLKVAGEISRWPDVDVEFAVDVLPLDLTQPT